MILTATINLVVSAIVFVVVFVLTLAVRFVWGPNRKNPRNRR